MSSVLEQSQIAPPSGTVDQLSLPLTFFDIRWLPFGLVHALFFYDFSCSKTHFINTIIPNLKKSLSCTLKHFLPLSGNLIYPLDDKNMPEIRYVTGDSVSVTFAEYSSKRSFDYLTASSHARNADEFYCLVPQFPQVTNLSDCKVIPALVLQVTLFPDIGISIGCVNPHALCDANTTFGFMKAWASIQNLGGDSQFLASNLQPSYDRSVINYPRELDTIYWNMLKNKLGSFDSRKPPINKVRATYVIGEQHIKRLKDFVLTKRPNLGHVSSFTVTCAFVWTCLVKSSVAIGEVNDDDTEFFLFAVDCRARLNPPAPPTYLGNCIAPCVVKSTRTKLVENEGLLSAVESIGEAIRTLVYNEKGILVNAELWTSQIRQIYGKSSVAVAGSPKFDVYDTDFGWGKPKTFEATSIDNGGISVSKSREPDASLEVTLSLKKNKIDAFAITFADSLNVA